MATTAENTGNVLTLTLKRVRTDVPVDSPYYHEPMDVNGVPTRVSGLPQHVVTNEVGHPNYVAPYEDLVACPLPVPAIPVTIDWNMTQDSAPYVNGIFFFSKEGVSIPLIENEPVTSLNIGDTLNIDSIHYALNYRWPDDASYTLIVENAAEEIIYQFGPGGSRDVSNIDNHNLLLEEDYYYIYATTQSSDATLAPLGFDVNNTTGFSGGVISIKSTDATTGLVMLLISEDNNMGSYNVKNDAGNQTIEIHNTTGSAINVRLRTVTATFDETFNLVANGIATKVLTKAGIIVDLMP